MDSRTATLLLRRATDQGLIDARAIDGIKRVSPAERAEALLAALRAAGVGAEGLAWMVLAADSATRTPEIPGYRLGELLGWGAAGGVWRAVQEAVGREVALKVVPLGRGADAAGFIAEVHALGQLNHPHVVTCHDAGTTGDRLFLAMELITGGDAERLRRAAGGRLDEARALAIVRDAALGLAAIAGAGLVHRDLKPANLLLTAEGRAKIGDLGLARPSGPAQGASWAVQGTPAFWSPEQVRGAALDVRSDIHALGATLYTLLCGRSPYAATSVLELIRAISERPVPDPAALLPDLSDATRTILLTTLAKDPALRHPTAEALVDDLNAALAGATPVHARALRQQAFASSAARPTVTPKSATDAPRPASGLRLAAASAVIAGTLLVGFGVGMASAGPSGSEERALRLARVMATSDGWTEFLTRFPASTQAPEAQASLKFLTGSTGVGNEPASEQTIDPQVRRLRGELRALDAQLLALTPVETTPPPAAQPAVPPVTPAAATPTVAPVLPETPVLPAAKPIPPRDIIPVAKPPVPRSTISGQHRLEPLSSEVAASLTIPANATRAEVDAFIRRVADTIPTEVNTWSSKDLRADALTHIPATQIPALIAALETYRNGPMHMFIEAAIPVVTQPDQAPLILPLLGTYPKLIATVERQHWQVQAKPYILALLREKKDLTALSEVTPCVRALLVEPDPATYPLLSEVFLRIQYGYYQRDLYNELTKAPGFDLDTVVATVWKRGGAYNGWEAFAPIAAQHGHLDALTAVVVRVPEHPPSHLPASKARAWLNERTDAPDDPTGAAAWLAAGPVYDPLLRRWHAKGATTTPASNF